MKKAAAVAFVVLLVQLRPSTQVAFDVASIKENKTVRDGGTMRLMPGGGITAAHIPAQHLITIAYDLKLYQLTGAPSWAADTYYDVIAKPAEAATRDQGFKMLQSLLVDRFKLAFHRETREMDGYALVQARPGVLGPKLRRSAFDCEKSFATTPQCTDGHISMTSSGSSMKANGAQIWSLLQILVGEVGAPVSDDTKLTGTFDLDLQWSKEATPTNDLTSIYTALQEQLGLKLEKRRVPVEMFVVDRFEHPTPD